MQTATLAIILQNADGYIFVLHYKGIQLTTVGFSARFFNRKGYLKRGSMKFTKVCFIGLVFVLSASAEPLLEGRVRLDSGQPVADAQVQLFDLTDLRRGAIARAMTDGTGYFVLPLAALGAGAAGAVRVGTELSQSVQSLDDHSLSTGDFVPSATGGVQPARAAHSDVNGWRKAGGLSHGDLDCGRGGGVYLPDDGGSREPDGADGAG